MRSGSDDPEIQAKVDRNMAALEAMEAKGRPEATEDQIKIWQAWGESEITRINRERGETT